MMTIPFFLNLSKPAKKVTKNQVLFCPCGLEKDCKDPMKSVKGKGKKGILIVDRACQLSGSSGPYLERILKEINIDLYEDCWVTSAVNCRTPEDRSPTGMEISACRSKLFQIIEQYSPEHVLVLGISGIKSIVEDRWHDNEGIGSINRWRGLHIPDQKVKAWIHPVFHPQFVQRSEKRDPQNKLWFRKDLKAFSEFIEQPAEWPSISAENNREILYDEKQILQTINGIIRKNAPTAFDYETTGLKPHVQGHKIYSCSLCSGGLSYSFLINKETSEHLKKFIKSPVPKIAQNIKFEEKWTRAILGLQVNNWLWDTMICSHFLDNRGHISGLKFQTYVRFGVADYSSNISTFLASDTPLGFNSIHKAPVEELLNYGADDSFYEYHLWKAQLNDIQYRDDTGFQFFMEGLHTLMDDEENGVVVDVRYIKKQREFLIKRVQAIKKRILQSPEGIVWQQRFPNINLDSNQQLASILYNEMGLTCTKKTKKGNASVDEEALEGIALEVPLVHDIIEARKLSKIEGTYLAGWEKQTGPDRIMRPTHNLHIATTYRSSVNDPNLQNVPIRDREAQRATRRGIKPRAHHHFGELDFGGIEVRIGACYHKDPMMLKYINDPTTDMHRDMSVECYLLDIEEVSKDARQGAKNQFVFPAFYGSYWANTGPGLYKWAKTCKTATGVDLITHLKKKGLKNEEQFVNHIKKVERNFWGERFKVYAKWKDQWWADYLKKGYFDTLTGFRCSGPMRKNEAVNYPIQGSAFHCLLKAKTLTKAHIEKEKMNTLQLGQIHDSGLFSIPPEEVEKFALEVPKIWCEDVRKIWDWIIVPLEVDFELAPMDAPWYEKKKFNLRR